MRKKVMRRFITINKSHKQSQDNRNAKSFFRYLDAIVRWRKEKKW